MTRELETEVWNYSNAKAATKLVILAIANEGGNSTREAVIPIAELMRLTGLARASVYLNLHKLEEMGEIKVLGDKHHPAAFRIREFLIWDGNHGKMTKANIYPEHYPQRGNVKDPERQRAIQAYRPRIGEKRRRCIISASAAGIAACIAGSPIRRLILRRSSR